MNFSLISLNTRGLIVGSPKNESITDINFGVVKYSEICVVLKSLTLKIFLSVMAKGNKGVKLTDGKVKGIIRDKTLQLGGVHSSR